MAKFVTTGGKIMPINVVLIEPRIPQNTGNIARTIAVTGARLHIVGPMGFEITDAKLKRAGLDYWKLLDITMYESIDEFYAKNSGEFYYFTTKAENRYSDIKFPENAYLVYGREDAGLPEELIFAHPGTSLRVPMMENARSLNLANTVAITIYEALRQQDFEGLKVKGSLTKYNWDDIEKTNI